MMTSIYSEHGQRPIGSADPNGHPARIVKTDRFERLFSHYTGLEGDELMAYLQDFQTRALEIYLYGCIHNGGFAALRERAHREYPAILQYAKKGNFLVVDLGCCLGTDVRQFLLDGGDAHGTNKIIAVDLEQKFIDLGQDLYKGPTPGIEFRTANLLDPTDSNVDDLTSKVNLLYTGAVFHLFDEAQQRVFAKKIASLLATVGEVAVFGWHRGAQVAGARPHRTGGIIFSHSPESWKELWTEILGADSKNWQINATLRYSWTAAEHVNEDTPVLQWSLWKHSL